MLDTSLALALASQVSVGLTPGGSELERARASLMAIGLMILNSNKDSDVQEVLQFPSYGTFEVQEDGSVSITITPPPVEPGA